MTAKRVRVGDVFTLARRSVAVRPTFEYQEIGVRSFGNGIFHKEPLSGVDLGNKRVFEIHPGDLIVSNVFAWEGAVAVADQAEAGMIGSHRFMTWVPDQSRVDAKFAYYYFTSARGIADLLRASPGSAGRNKTLGIAAFENLEIPLPGLDEQRAIVARLDRIQAASLQTISDLTPFISACDQLEAGLIEGELRLARIRLSDIAQLNPRPTREVPEQIHFVPMADLDDVTGTITGTQVRDRIDLRSGYKQFVSGDVIFARITPCMQNGKSAIFEGKIAPVGYGSTEFHVLRVASPAIARRLHAVTRSRWFRSEATRYFTGTAGQQRVPAQFLRDVTVPDIRDERTQGLADRLCDIDARRRHMVALDEHRRSLATALPRAARNEVFAAP